MLEIKQLANEKFFFVSLTMILLLFLFNNGHKVTSELDLAPIDYSEEGNAKLDSLRDIIICLNQEVTMLTKDNALLKEKLSNGIERTERTLGNSAHSRKWLLGLIGLILGYCCHFLFPIQFNLLGGRKMYPEQSNFKTTSKSQNREGRTKAEVTCTAKKGRSLSTDPRMASRHDHEDFKGNWVIAGASEVGRSHVRASPPIPCQDSHAVRQLENGWGIAVSCDGAGSAKLSHLGSELIANEVIQLFEAIVKENNWIDPENGHFPNQLEWEKLCLKAFKKLRYDLEQYAKHKGINANDLACTVIVIIYSPYGLFVTHIGDGRAGYRDRNGNWKPVISPHKGEEANQTIFLTSNPWLSEDFFMSGVRVPECRIIIDEVTAFTLMSDGCESHSFELGYFDEGRQVFVEQNLPHAKFFEPLVQTLLNMNEAGMKEQEILEKWSSFVRSGTKNLNNEPDDKTLILGVLTD